MNFLAKTGVVLLAGLILIGAAAVGVRYAIGPPVPASPDQQAGAAILEATIRAKVDPLLDGDSALYYAGVLDGLANELEDGRGISTWPQFGAYLRRLFEAADRAEPAEVSIKPVVLSVFTDYDQRRGSLADDRLELQEKARAFASACRKSR